MIYDITGRKIFEGCCDLENEFQWDGTNSHGEEVADGMYIYILTSGSEKRIGKVALVKSFKWLTK